MQAKISFGGPVIKGLAISENPRDVTLRELANSYPFSKHWRYSPKEFLKERTMKIVIYIENQKTSDQTGKFIKIMYLANNPPALV